MEKRQLLNRKRGAEIALLVFMFVFFGGKLTLKGQTIAEIQRSLDNGQPSKALKDVNLLLAADPRNEKLFYLQGRANFDLEDYSSAKNSFYKGTNLGARYPWNFIGLGACNAVDNNFTDARAILEKARELNPSNEVKVTLAIAKAYLESSKKDFIGAGEVELYRVLGPEPNNIEALILLGDLYFKQNIDDLALSNYEKALTIKLDYIEAHLRVGLIYKKKKEFKDAASAFGKCIALDTNYAPAYKEMADMYGMAQDYPKAKDYYAKYLSIVGNDIPAKIRYAIFLNRVKEYQQSMDVFREIEKDTTTLLMLRFKGYNFVELNSPDSALSNLNRFFREAKESYVKSEDYESVAKAYEQKKDPDLAAENYRKAIKCALDNEAPKPELGWSIAEVYRNAGQFAKQAMALENFLSGKPKPKLKEINALGLAYEKIDSFLKADSAYARMVELNPDIHLGYLFRGRVNTRLDSANLKGLAKPYYEKVIEILSKGEEDKAKYKSDFIVANNYLGSYYTIVMKDCATARPFWDTILLLDPENKAANSALEYCKGK